MPAAMNASALYSQMRGASPSKKSRKEQKGRIEKGKMKDMAVVSQLASSVQYKSCCMMDYRTITKKFENGVVTVSDEGLFLKKVTSGKGYVLQSEEEIVLRREESKSLALSSHSCQGIAGALGSGLRHYLREGQVDKELGKAAVKGGAYSWGMSIVTQSIERRHAGGGAAAFAFVQAAQQIIWRLSVIPPRPTRRRWKMSRSPEEKPWWCMGHFDWLPNG